MLFSGKKGYRFLVIVVFLIVCFSTFASGAKYNSIIWVSPAKNVEMSHGQYNISVNNYGSTYSIVALYAHLAGLVPTQAISVSDWDGAMDNTTSRVWWENGTINNNVFAALFQFSGITPSVASNTSLNLTITTIYYDGHNRTHLFPITIFDDTSGPELENMTPPSGSLFIQDSTITVSVDAVDPETGAQGVIFSHGLCGNNVTNVTLAKDGSHFNSSVNLSGYTGGAQVCYTFTATSGGGATTTHEGTFKIDGAAPIVTPISPMTVANSTTPFTFSVTDDASPSMFCEVIIDETVMGNATVTNGENASIEAQPTEEDTYSWKARCTDSVGHIGESAKISYFLDLSSPEIEIDDYTGILLPSSLITVNIEDNDEVESVSYSINGETSIDGSASMVINMTNFIDGLNTLAVVATDAVGNTDTKTVPVLVDKSAPIVALSSPLNTTDIHASFVFTAVDTYDNKFDCILFIGGVPVATKKATNGSENTIRYNHSSLGASTWRVDCEDDGGNTGSSETWIVNFVDETDPDISITSAAYHTRGAPFSAQAHITDISAIDSVSAVLIDSDGEEHTALVNVSGSTYTISYGIPADAPIGIWTIRVHAEDALGNDNTMDAAITVVNAYVFDLSVDPNPSSPSGNVTLTGTVRKDDGRTIPETQVEILLPNGFAYLITISDTGAFSHIFAASEEAADYVVRVNVTQALTGSVHKNTTTFTVRQPSNPILGDGSGKQSRGRGSGNLGVDSSSSIAVTSAPTISPQVSSQEVGQIIADSTSSTDIAESDADGFGVGSATGIFSLRDAMSFKAVLTAIIILLICGLVAWHPTTKKKKE